MVKQFLRLSKLNTFDLSLVVVVVIVVVVNVVVVALLVLTDHIIFSFGQ